MSPSHMGHNTLLRTRIMPFSEIDNHLFFIESYIFSKNCAKK